MRGKQQPEYKFDLSGGHLALDFANTISRRDNAEHRKEHLNSYSDLVSFATQSEILSAKEAQELRALALSYPDEARHVFRKLIRLRETLFRVFARAAAGEPANPDDLNLINDCALEAMSHRTIAAANGGYEWQWQAHFKEALDRLVWPIAQASAELLTSRELKIVRLCEAADCQWLFLDRSRNRSRRWCDMKSCGNRAKARRHYKRTH